MPDVLRYSELMQQVQTKSTALQQALVTCVETCPWLYTLWPQYLPTLISSPTGTLCVVDGASGLTCNVCCLWTVPAGASRAVFQIWGGGAGVGSPQCCGGAPYGQNGAYAVASIPVTPGCQYTLCAGCVSTCFSSSAGGMNGASQACKSFVTGYGLTNFCADGACYSINRWICNIHGATGCCRFQAAGQISAGGCTCDGGGFYCFASSCGSCGIIGFTKDSLLTWYGSTSLTGGRVCGIPAMWGQANYDCCQVGYYVSAPLVGINHNMPLEITTTTWCTPIQGSTICGKVYRDSCSCRELPGAGGYPSVAYGGPVSICSDRGRSGMVRVTWC